MRNILLLLLAGFFIKTNAQQINGVFTDFARNDTWGNTVINTATQQTTDYITLGGYYEGSQTSKKIPLVLQISPSGVIRNDFGSSGAFLMSSVNSNGSSQADRIYVANTSTTANSNQLIVAGRYDGGDGFLIKTFPTGSRPTAFNRGRRCGTRCLYRSGDCKWQCVNWCQSACICLYCKSAGRSYS